MSTFGGFSEECLEDLFSEFPFLRDSSLYDFTSCQRPNGTVYGTGGKCRKGSEIEQRRAESIAHLNNSIRLLKEKRDQTAPEGRVRISRLIDKLEGDLKAISGNPVVTKAAANRPGTSTSSQVRKPVDRSGMKPVKSRNEEYGFYGTTRDSRHSDAGKRFENASRALQSQGLEPVLARRLLDSSWGRHLADEISRVPTREVDRKVREILESQSPRQRKDFEKLWKTMMDPEYDD